MPGRIRGKRGGECRMEYRDDLERGAGRVDRGGFIRVGFNGSPVEWGEV